MRKLGIITLAFLMAPLIASAATQHPDLSITPVVIDEKAQARDILKQSITLVNTSERKLQLYPIVNNVDSEDGTQAFKTAITSDDRAASLANWIEISRGVIELGPGEEKVIPFVMRVNMNAIAGSYHARIAFGEGSTRSSAEGQPPLGEVMVNLEVKANIKEVLQLNKFFTENFFFSGDDVVFNYQLENIGNQELQPQGEVRIYNRRGEEVASIDVNKEGKAFSPDQSAQLASVWSAVEGFGRYKAFLTVEYGRGQQASVQDTIYFWIIPWKHLLAVFLVSIVALAFFALYFHRWFEERHLHRLAHAGLIAADAHEAIISESASKWTLGGVVATALLPFIWITHVGGRLIPSRVSPASASDTDEEEELEAPAAPPPLPVAPPPEVAQPRATRLPQSESKSPTQTLRDRLEQNSGAGYKLNSSPRPSRLSVYQDGIIDLKKMQQKKPEGPASVEGAVINLKKR